MGAASGGCARSATRISFVTRRVDNFVVTRLSNELSLFKYSHMYPKHDIFTVIRYSQTPHLLSDFPDWNLVSFVTLTYCSVLICKEDN